MLPHQQAVQCSREEQKRNALNMHDHGSRVAAEVPLFLHLAALLRGVLLDHVAPGFICELSMRHPILP